MKSRSVIAFSVIFITLIFSLLAIPFIFPKIAGYKSGYIYSWIPIYSPLLGEYWIRLYEQGILKREWSGSDKYIIGAASIIEIQHFIFPKVKNY